MIARTPPSGFAVVTGGGRRQPLKAVVLLSLAGVLAGCGTARETAPTAPAGTAQVRGTVMRAGVQLAGMKVKLYDDLEQVQVDSTFTDGGGAFGFDNVGAGKWMVKVSPTAPSDLGYVRWFLELTTAGQSAVVPPLDVSAHEFDLVEPADGAHVARPGFSSPLIFRWSGYNATYLWASARLSVAAGELAWSSPQNPGTEAAWNGVGNESPYTGQALPAATYTWRVKLRLPNGVQAASRERVLILE